MLGKHNTRFRNPASVAAAAGAIFRLRDPGRPCYHALMQPLMRAVPWMLILLRMLIAVSLVADAADGMTSAWFVVGFLIAAGSDIIDGMIARRLHVATRGLRLLDSYADGLLYGAVFLSLWFVHPHILRAFAVPLITLVITQAASWAWCWLKFAQVTSYHSYLAKAWGLTLILSTVRLFGWGRAGWSLWLVIVVGIASHFEDALITWCLPHWTHDVPSVLAAWRLRMLARRTEAA